MKKFFAILCLGLTYHLIAQPSARELKQHRQLVAESKLSNKGISSLDTFFCAGKAKALVQVNRRDTLLPGQGDIVMVREQSLIDLNGGTLLIYIHYFPYGDKLDGKTVVPFHLYTFPTLGLSCKVNEKPDLKGVYPEPDVYATICKYDLFNGQALDTMKVEMFITLKGEPKNEKDKEPNPYLVIVERNRNAPLTFTGENIEQEGVVIGSCKEGTAESPAGLLKKYSIYNYLGVLLCTATETAPGSNDWRLLVNPADSNFYSLKTRPGFDKEDIVSYIISLGVL